jgi:hypothetical protein
VRRALSRGPLLVFALLGFAFGAASIEAAPALTCKIGPIERSYGGTKWLVYGCDDKKSVILVSAPGSPALPFVFIFAANRGSYSLHGEGTGRKAPTDAAMKELSKLSDAEIESLFAEAARVK